MKPTSTRDDRIQWVLFALITVVFLVTTQSWNYSVQEHDVEYRAGRADAVEQGSWARRVAFGLLGLYGLASLLAPGGSRLRISGTVGWSIVFCVVWAFLSVIWTVDLNLTIRRLVAFSTFGLCAVGLAKHLSVRNLGLLIVSSTTAFLVLGVIAELNHSAFAPLISGYRFSGTQHANSQGVNCSLLFLSSLFLRDRAKTNQWVLSLWALVAFVFLFLTRSRTSFICLIVAVLAYKTLTAGSSRKTVAVILVVLALMFAFLVLGESVGSALFNGVQLGRSEEAGATLESRQWLWMACRGYAGQRPMLGYGFNGFWTSERMTDIADEQSWNIGSAHSVYVDVVLSLGLVGLVAFLTVVTSALFRSFEAFRKTGNPRWAFLFGFLIFYLFHGTLESTFFNPCYYTFLSVIVFSKLGFFNEIEG